VGTTLTQDQLELSTQPAARLQVQALVNRFVCLYGAKIRYKSLTRCLFSCLGCSPVLIDQSAEDSVASDRGVEVDHGGRVVVGWVLA
jgi:hypothetical protein